MTSDQAPNMNLLHHLNGHEFVLYDEDCISGVNSELFQPKKNASDENLQGRGSVYLFEHQGLNLVLRHYRRGGLVRHLIADNYVFTGLQRTRMWREFHLLQALTALGLPVPRVIAVRCVKTSPLSYRGDLITQTIENSQTLAQVLEQMPMNDELWRDLGCLIACFHSHNVYHADLNANNVMLDTAGKLYLIDFDRGELRDSYPSTWRQANLDRLFRSFQKLSNLNSNIYFSPDQWALFLSAYSAAL